MTTYNISCTCNDDKLCNLIYNEKNKIIDNVLLESMSNNLKMYEDDNYIYIKNLIGAVAKKQNKNNRVYDQETLKTGALNYENLIKKYDYFRFMMNGHSDDDGYDVVAGIVLKQKIDELNKRILLDVAIPKGNEFAEKVKRLGIVGVSMRIFAENTEYYTKERLKQIDPEIEFIEDITQAFVDNNKISYLTGKGYIIRYDFVNLPSFNDAFMVSDNAIHLKNESTSINIEKLSNKKIETLIDYDIYNNDKDKRFITSVNTFIKELIKNGVDEYNVEDYDKFFDKYVLKQGQRTINKQLEKFNNYLKVEFETNDSNFYNNVSYLSPILKDVLDKLYNDMDVRPIINFQTFVKGLKQLVSNSKRYSSILQPVVILDYVLFGIAYINQYYNKNTTFYTFKKDYEIDFEIAPNRKTYFLNNYYVIYEDFNKKEEIELNDVYSKLYILKEHINKYSNILTQYGSIIEVLKFLEAIPVIKVIEEKEKKINNILKLPKSIKTIKSENTDINKDEITEKVMDILNRI